VILRPLAASDGSVDLAELHRLFSSVFPGPRAPGWLPRKLVRECVDADLSVIARDGDRGPGLGFVLVGRPPRLAPTYRTAGVGVAPTARRRGLGRALLRAAQAASRAAGADALQALATAGSLAFYEAAGFRRRRSHATLTHVGTGTTAAHESGEPWPATDVELACAWLGDVWQRTPERERWCWSWHAGIWTAWGTREATGWVVHGLRAPPIHLAAALGAVRAATPAGARIHVAGVDLASPTATAAAGHGWRCAQDAWLVEKTLDT
jgi:ribosomal protein S18 acetylase RimI-like enzyme